MQGLCPEQGKLEVSPGLRPAYVVRSWAAQVCQFLETLLAREQSKTTQSESDSSPFLQKSSVARWGMQLTPAAAAGKQAFFLFAKRHLGTPQPSAAARGPGHCLFVLPVGENGQRGLPWSFQAVSSIWQK